MTLSGTQEAVLFLAAAVITVPLFRKLGMGAVIGYLVAGMVIGPQLLGFVTNVENILEFSELGVVLLLFVIGLELQPSRLWALAAFGIRPGKRTGARHGRDSRRDRARLRIAGNRGAGDRACRLSLSSTALALQTLAEKKQLTTQHGRAAFAILLFQDLAAIPLLGVFAFLGGSAQGLDWLQHGEGSWRWWLPSSLAGAGCCARICASPLRPAAARYLSQRRCWWWSAPR